MTTDPDPAAEVARLQRMLARERDARHQAEDIAEAATARLYAALHRLEAEREDVRALATAAAHDVLNPLTSLQGFAELLAAGDLDPKTRALLTQRARASASYAVALVRGLFDVMRSGLVQGEPEPVDLGDLLEGLRLDLLVRHPDATVTCEVAATAHAVPAQVQRLFDNLMENAARYAGPQAHVLLRTAPSTDPGSVVVVVADDGPGVPPDVRDRMFDPFVRGVDPPGQGAGSTGHGIGLAVCRRIARAVGGDVWLDDAPSSLGGAAFAVRLPAG